ncbi:MAG TPA: hypothetical protein VG713_15775, partial [Pirellulales bacterium]|nr:hypothetical protein [Pirellulales bacterium]
VIMFCGLGYAPTSEWLLWNVSRCFAQRGERVLLLRLASIHDVIDEPAGEPNSGELVASGTAAEGAHSQAAPRYPAVMRGQSFGDGRENLSELVRSTNVLGVDELRSADLPWPREAWGTQRMTALLDALRERYTLVLISGPTVAQPVDLQMLAARVDGIVFTAPRGKRLHPSATAVANDLLRLRASVLGVIA